MLERSRITGQIDLPPHPTPTERKRCTKAAPYAMGAAAESLISVPASTKGNRCCRFDMRAVNGTPHPAFGHLLPAVRGEGRYRIPVARVSLRDTRGIL